MLGGKILAADTPENLQKIMAGGEHVIAEIASGGDDPALVWSSLPELANYHVKALDGDYQRWTLTSKAGTDLRPAVFALARERNWQLRELTRSRHSLEDIYVQVTRPGEEESE
jgi:ABC-2 type transport system ATP-binding protein